jgi:hypothetical protein
MDAQSTGRRRVALSGEEADVHSRRWRRWAYAAGRAGYKAAVKRRTNRRERREGRRESVADQ